MIPLLKEDTPSIEERACTPGYSGYIPERSLKISPDKDVLLAHNPQKFSQDLIPNYKGFVSGYRSTFGQRYCESVNECRKNVRTGPDLSNTQCVTLCTESTSAQEPSPQLLCTNNMNETLKERLSVPGYSGHCAQKLYTYGKSHAKVLEECATRVPCLNRTCTNKSFVGTSTSQRFIPGYTGFVQSE
ncbi:hypothetical protein RCL1_001318 [Eukaryota sp. TZLM3-RCL]